MTFSALSSIRPPRGFLSLAILVNALSLVSAHPHHGDGGKSEAPIDAILWIHILVQLVVWGGIFGIGMVLGIVRYARSAYTCSRTL